MHLHCTSNRGLAIAVGLLKWLQKYITIFFVIILLMFQLSYPLCRVLMLPRVHQPSQ